MDVGIKEYEKTDEAQLIRLIGLSFEDEILVTIVRESKFECAYAAFAEDTMIGVIVGWVSNYHTNCTYFRIVSAPFYTNYGVEEALLAKVENEARIARPLKTSIWETAITLKELYRRKGFKEIRRTYMPTLHLDGLKEEIKDINDNTYPIKTLAEISANNALMEKLTLLVRRNYDETHKVDPVVDADLDEWKKLIAAEDTIMQGSYIFLDTSEKDIVAYSFIHESDNAHTYELGWCGCSDERYKGCIPQLIFQQAKYAINANVEAIVGEFDTTDHNAMEVFKSFPFTPCPTWITYIKK